MPGFFLITPKSALFIIVIAIACLLVTGMLYKFSDTWQLLTCTAAIALASSVMLLHKEES